MFPKIFALLKAPLPLKAGFVKAGLVVKVWHIALAGVLLLAGSASAAGVIVHNAGQSNTSDVPQRVVVFLAGLNTQMTNCQEGTFDTPSSNQNLRPMIAQALQATDPYTEGCNANGNSLFNYGSTFILYSYHGGHMDTQHGVWIPDNYDACNDVNYDELNLDILHFDQMLERYHKVYPNARFTIVGHSLGGLVGLHGAYDYAVRLGYKYIDKVITIDSPLWGVLPGLMEQPLVDFETGHCLHSGPVIGDLETLANIGVDVYNKTNQDITCPLPLDEEHAALSACETVAMSHQGISVETLGNDVDPLFCGGVTQFLGGLVNTCDGQLIKSHFLANYMMYHVCEINPYLVNSCLYDPEAGHGAILKDSGAEQEIVNYILGSAVPPVPVSDPTLTPTATATPSGNGCQTDNSQVISNSPAMTENPGQQFTLQFTYQNDGCTTWTDSGGYALACDTHYNSNSNCMGGNPVGFNGSSVAPGQQYTFNVPLTAPSSPGTYFTAWDMTHNGGIFGNNHVYVQVTVPSAQPDPTPQPDPSPSPSWQPWYTVNRPACDDYNSWSDVNQAATRACPSNGLVLSRYGRLHWAELDLNTIYGSNYYDQTTFQVSVHTAFLKPSDTSVWNGLVVQTPQGGACGGFILAVNSNTSWQLQSVNSDCSVSTVASNSLSFDPTNFTMQITVQNGQLWAYINGIQLATVTDNLNPSQGAIGLLEESSGPTSTAFLYYNFEIDHWS